MYLSVHQPETILLSKKYPYPKNPAYGVDVNNPDNPDNRLILQSRLEIRMEIRSSIKYHKKLAQLYCNSLNGMKSKKMARIEYEAALEEAYEELRGSDEYERSAPYLTNSSGWNGERSLRQRKTSSAIPSEMKSTTTAGSGCAQRTR